MKNKIILSMIIMVVTIALPIVSGCSKKTDTHSESEHKTIYTCPMHPTYLSHKPGHCPICGMTLVPVVKSGHNPANTEKHILYYRDAMNPSFTTDKPGKAPDGMDLVPVYEEETGGTGVKIDPAMIQSIGVTTEKAAVRSLTREIRTSATIMPDERQISLITTKVMGYVDKLYVNYTGQQVKKGQPLYNLYSPDLVSLQSEYLIALKNASSNSSDELLQSARQRLLNWDISEDQIAELEKRGTPQKSITILSPASGIVAEKMIVAGQSIEPGMQLYKVIDYSRIWVEGNIYQQDVPLVRIGQTANIELDYYAGETFKGMVTYISPELNMESRTLMVRVELANTADLKIKPGMNASIRINTIINTNALTVPDQAVIHSGARTIIVIAKGAGYFEPREVTIGQTAGGYTEVIKGINVGDDIVISSQFLIDSESNLKAAVMKMAGNQEPSTRTLPETLSQKPADKPHLSTAPVYICPMKSDSVSSSKPGQCPKCGMDLVLKK